MVSNLISIKAQGRWVSPGETSSLRIVAAALFALVVAGGAQAGDREAYHEGPIRPDLLYHNYCSVCHGDRGDGRSRASGSFVPPPRDFTAPAATAELNRDRMINSVTNGVPGTAMAGWKVQLNGKEIAAVVDYVTNAMIKPHQAIRDGRGLAIYKANCSSCHADDGRGVVYKEGSLQRASPDFATPKASAEFTRDSMIYSVRYGKSGTLMVDFGDKLSNQDIEAVVDYVRIALMLPTVTGASGIIHGHSDGTPQNAEPSQPVKPTANMTAPLPSHLSGNPGSGHGFYLANCVACHGEKGDGKGPRAYFINPRPRDFLDADSRRRLNRPALFEAISNGRLGSEMPAWSKVLGDKEISDIAEYVFQQFIRSAPPANISAVSQ